MNTSQLYKEANIPIDDDWTGSNQDIVDDSLSHPLESDDESDTFSETNDDDSAP